MLSRRSLLIGIGMGAAAIPFVAKAAKVKVCHIPPGNKKNARRIEIDQSSLADHLAHGDFVVGDEKTCPKKKDEKKRKKEKKK